MKKVSPVLLISAIALISCNSPTETPSTNESPEKTDSIKTEIPQEASMQLSVNHNCQQATLSWDSVKTASAYVLSQSTDSVLWTPIDTVFDTTQFKYPSTKTGTYWFKVAACTKAVDSVITQATRKIVRTSSNMFIPAVSFSDTAAMLTCQISDLTGFTYIRYKNFRYAYSYSSDSLSWSTPDTLTDSVVMISLKDVQKRFVKVTAEAPAYVESYSSEQGYYWTKANLDNGKFYGGVTKIEK